MKPAGECAEQENSSRHLHGDNRERDNGREDLVDNCGCSRTRAVEDTGQAQHHSLNLSRIQPREVGLQICAFSAFSVAEILCGSCGHRWTLSHHPKREGSQQRE